MSNRQYEFKNEQTRALLACARERFGDEPEFLWINIPDAAVLRCPETGQWYALIMTAQKSSLGAFEDETTETIDLICDPDEIEKIADEKKIFRGKNMNPRHWITICTDNSLDTEEILRRLGDSHDFASGKRGTLDAFRCLD